MFSENVYKKQIVTLQFRWKLKFLLRKLKHTADPRTVDIIVKLPMICRLKDRSIGSKSYIHFSQSDFTIN